MSNRKKARSTPVLRADHLEYLEETPIGRFYHTVLFGSPEWLSWLERGNTWSYDGLYTCRREKRRGTYYWYAFKKDELTGKLQKEYLGKAADITKDKIIATWLAFRYGKDSAIYKLHTARD
jgi:hypothetical protein